MSRFSTINSQHSASRDLERQKLERMIGQLRREVDSSPGAAAGNSQKAERRFQPSRRRGSGGHPSRCPAGEPGDDVTMSTAQKTKGPAQQQTCRPGPGPAELGGDRAQSVEIAWLWRARSRLDEEEGEVATFLARHGLDRYAALLADDPSGVGSSLDVLLEATDETLAQAGLPESPRDRLRTAIQAEDAARAADRAASAMSAARNRPQSTASSSSTRAVVVAQPPVAPRTPAPRPLSSSSSTAVRPASSKSDVAAPDAVAASPSSAIPEKWGRLGRPPPGWRPTTAPGAEARDRPRLLDGPIVLVDACSGGAADIAEVDSEAEEEPCLMRQELEEVVEVVLPPTPAVEAASPLHDAIVRRRPSTPAVEKVYCYECFRQFNPQSTIVVEDPIQAASRRCCGEACAEGLRRAITVRSERERELSRLRDTVLGDCCNES